MAIAVLQGFHDLKKRCLVALLRQLERQVLVLEALDPALQPVAILRAGDLAAEIRLWGQLWFVHRQEW